jgi:hypothetical protein
MVAFKDIKVLKEEESLPSGKMTAAKLFPRGEMKYVRAIAQSVASGKTFVFAGEDGPVRGVVEKIVLKMHGGEIPIDDPLVWGEWAEKTYLKKDEGPNAVVNATRFVLDGEEYALNQMYKTAAAVGGLKINLGDTAEAILGSAITAKFEAGGRDINVDDVLRILKEVVAKGSVSATADYQEKEIQGDAITFKLSLNAVSLHGLKKWILDKDPMGSTKELAIVKEGVRKESADTIQKNVKDAVAYANNNKRAKVAVDKAKADPNANEVHVISDGGDATQQSVTKVDLKITYDGQVTRLLSLKAGRVKQFGQVSGATFEVASNFFESTINVRLPDDMKQEHDWKEPTDPDHKLHNLNKGPFKKMYAAMADQVKEYTAGDNVNKEFNLVKTVYDAINYHATRNEEGVTMVILSPDAKTAYKELAFDQRLYKALELYDLKLVNETNLSQHRISVVGTLKGAEAKAELGKGANKLDGKAILVQLSTRMSSGAIRNLVEMGPLLKDLADIEKLEKAQVQQQKQEEPKGIEAMKKAGNAKADAEAGERKKANDPNAKVEETLMKPSVEFGPTFDIVDDLHIYMRNNKDMYRSQYFPMLCNMQKAIQANEKISVKNLMMPTIRACGDAYNKEFQLANTMEDLMTLEQARELAKKIYDEEMPLIRKGAYK